MTWPSENKNKFNEHATYRILMFAPGFAPYSFSENIVNSKLALAFQNHGWEIDIISKVDAGPLYSMDWHAPWLPLKDSTHTIEYPHGNSLIRLIDLLRQLVEMRYPIGGLRWAGRALDRALALHKQKPYHVVLSRAPNDIGHVPALAFAKKTKVPLIANWNDPPAHLWPAPYKSAESLLDKSVSQRLMQNVFQQASFVTFPSERLRNHVVRSLNKNVCLSKTSIVPHIGLIDYASKRRKPDGCFRICHAGNLSKERNPENFFAGIELFLKRAIIKKYFEVLILGTNDHALDYLAEKHDLIKYVKVSGGSRYLDTLAVLEQSDVLAVVEAPCTEGIFLPSKVADYAQVGRPILAVSPGKSTLADLIRQTKAGEFADCNRPEEIADSLMALYKSWCNDRLVEDYSSTLIWNHFSPENIVNKYDEIFKSLI
jgi:glycosyltransferase involved in cell wall biosynthesis